MSFLVGVGYALVVAGGGVLGHIFWKTRQLPTPEAGFGPPPVGLPTDRLNPHADRQESLEVVVRKQTIRLLGEEAEREVQATVTLTEMTKTGDRWHETGTAYRALVLAGDVWIFKVPRREGGEPIWVKATLANCPYQPSRFFTGLDNKPGPARQFKDNGQTTPIPFVLPEEFGDATEYHVTDIGRFGTEVDGEEDIFRTDDQYPFVSAHAVDGSRVLIYLDRRKDMARGSGGLFIGEVFEPEIDIASLL